MLHPSAFVSAQANVHPGAFVGPWCVVDAGATVAEGVVLEPRVHVCGGAELGAHCHVYDGAVVGGDPQDLKYQGEPTRLKVGARCVIREYCTLHRGTGEGGLTEIGEGCLLMAYTHIGHDSVLGAGVCLSNGVQLGGHVKIGRFATIGGNTAVQQRSLVGAYSFVGGTLKIDRSVPPFAKALGNPLRYAGLNLHALQKHGFSAAQIHEAGQVFRRLYQGAETVDAVAQSLADSGSFIFSEFFTEWLQNPDRQIVQRR